MPPNRSTKPGASQSLIYLICKAIAALCGLWGVPGNPVARDIDAAAYPHGVVLLHVIEKVLQRAEAARPADQPAMQPDRHHFWRVLALGVEHVEAVAQVVKELLAAI